MVAMHGQAGHENGRAATFPARHERRADTPGLAAISLIPDQGAPDSWDLTRLSRTYPTKDQLSAFRRLAGTPP